VGHIGVILENDEVYLWGSNRNSKSIPYLESEIIYHPTKLEVDFVISSLALGSSSTLALSVEGKVYCWGGRTRVDDSQTIILVSQNATAILSGKSVACYVQEGAFFCWGGNEVYELGLGQRSDQVRSPRLVDFEWQQMESKTRILCYSLHSQLSLSTVEISPPGCQLSRNSLLSNLEEYINDETFSDLTIVVGEKKIHTSKVCRSLNLSSPP
jgi:alpha-tubulin suppressor-like RCC1 family protein